MSYRATELTMYKLGLFYGSYRLVITCCLLIVFLLNNSGHFTYPALYCATLIIYFVSSCVQLIAYRNLPVNTLDSAFILFFIIDIIAFSILTFSSSSSNLPINLLFVIAIFAASILLSSRIALAIMLIAIISVTYPYFVSFFFDSKSSEHIGNSVILSAFFIVVYILGQITTRHLQSLEQSNHFQSLEINRLQNINRYILEQSNTGYLVLDENLHLVLSNPAAQILLGIQPASVEEKQPLYLLQPNLFETIVAYKTQHEFSFQFESNAHYSTQIQIKKLNLQPNVTLILLIIEDRKLLNQQVQQLKLAALGQLTASIAHEIRNPLAAIVQANQLYLGSDAAQQEMLQKMIAKQSVRIDKIIKDTLNMVKNKPTQSIQIALNEFIPRFLQEDLADVKEKIALELEDQLLIQFDEDQLRQVLINLIRNALRHNDPNKTQILLRCYHDEQLIYIEVQDFGLGIANQDLKHLFQPFFSTEINGTGLGLYLSSSFCEANQAKLMYVESQVGACFRICCVKFMKKE